MAREHATEAMIRTIGAERTGLEIVSANKKSASLGEDLAERGEILLTPEARARLAPHR